MSIKPIDSWSIDQITSGQVVTSLSSAVKELIENSLDAGGTIIEIKLFDHGRDGLRVQDNGCGVDEADFEFLTMKHATSKLEQFSDLENVSTLGFRGEALASLCALANVTVITGKTGGYGHEIIYDNSGKITSQKKIATPKGTIVQVHGLFHNLPVRRKDFERNSAREYTKTVAMIQEYALLSPSRITLEHVTKNKSNLTLRSQGADLLQRIACVYGFKRTKSVCAVNFRSTHLNNMDFSLDGFISKPAIGMGDTATTCQLIAVNGRPSQQPKIIKTIVEVYKQFNLTETPFFVLNLAMDTKTYDVNVSPDKRALLLHNESSLIQAIRQAFVSYFNEMAHIVPRAELPPAKRSKGNFLSLEAFTSSGSVIEQKSIKHIEESSSESEEEVETGLEESGDEHEHEHEHEQDMDVQCEEEEDETMVQIGSNHKELEITRSLSTETSVIYDDPISQDINEVVEVAEGEITENDEFKSAASEEDSPREIQNPQIEPSNESDIPESNQSFSSLESSDNEAGLVDDIGAENESHESQEHSDSHCHHDASPSLEKSFDSSNALHKIDTLRPSSQRLPQQKKTLNTHIHLPINLNDVKKAVDTDSNDSNDSSFNKLRNLAIDEDDVEERLQLSICKNDFENMEVVGQFNLGFILVVNHKHNHDDLFVVDQHASDEIYNFERLQKNTILSRQPLINPHQLELSAVEELMIQEHMGVFENNGFTIGIHMDQPPGHQCFLEAVPFSKSTIFDENDVFELLSKIKEEPDNNDLRCSKLRAMFAMRACRSSIMVGRPLDMPTMRKILRHLGTLDKPWNCPHGRPTLRHITTLS